MSCDRNREISTLLGLLNSPDIDEALKANMVTQLKAWGKTEKWIKSKLNLDKVVKKTINKKESTKSNPKSDETELDDSDIHDMDRLSH